mmetsp:Transcript_76907/g.178389  ORF Transcript_76907/g.178389 Transcript_76907/m.178389 type:complete len:104 (-) Transcript_76907:1954-2265(-)
MPVEGGGANVVVGGEDRTVTKCAAAPGGWLTEVAPRHAGTGVGGREEPGPPGVATPGGGAAGVPAGTEGLLQCACGGKTVCNTKMASLASGAPTLPPDREGLV